MTHLSYRQWTQKHAARLEGLSTATKRERYDQYRTTEAMRDRSTETELVDFVGKKKRNANVDHAMAEKERVLRLMKSDNYISQLLDPFNHPPARYPCFDANKTQVFTVKFNVPVFSDSGGEAFFFLRPGIANTHAVSGTASDSYGNGIPWPSFDQLPSAVRNAGILGAGGAKVPQPPLWAESSWMITHMIDPQQVATMRSNMNDVRCTGAGMRFIYSGPELLEAGTVAVSRWKGTNQVPTINNVALDLAPTTGNQLQQQVSGFRGPSYETVQSLDTAIVHDATAGFTATWAPWGPDAATAWRSNRNTVIAPDAGFDQITDLAVTGEALMPPPCAGDPDLYRAMLNLYANVNGVLPTAATGAGTGTSTFFNLPTATGLRDTLVGIPGSSANEAAFRGARIPAFVETSMMDGDCALIATFSGLQPSIQIGTMEVKMNFEGIAQSRELEFGAGARLSRQIPSDLHRGLSVAHHIPASATGPKAAAEKRKAHISGWAETIKDIGGGIMTVYNVGKELVDLFA